MSRLRHLLLQLLACVGAWVFIAPAQHLAAWAVLQGLLAALLAIVLRQPGWQRLAHGLFVPAAVAMRQAGIPPGWYLLALLLTLALGRNALVERVPLYRSGRRVADRLAGLLAADAALLEAGCGRPARLAVGCRSFWKEDWGSYDAIYVFLSPEPMPKVWRKFLSEGRPGSLLISNTFEVPDIQPDERIPLGGPLQKELLIWRHPNGSQ